MIGQIYSQLAYFLIPDSGIDGGEPWQAHAGCQGDARFGDRLPEDARDRQEHLLPAAQKRASFQQVCLGCYLIVFDNFGIFLSIL